MLALEIVARLLIVDDDPHIREVVAYALTEAGHQITEREDGQAGLEAARAQEFDLVVLDVMMPSLDGIEVCRRIREKSIVPVLFLSARDEEIDRVIGLEVGGDDYLTKPFGPRELVARVKAMLRRAELSAATGQRDESKVRKFGRLSLDADRFELSWNDEDVTLTVTEFQLLEALMSAPGKVYTRSELVERAYHYDHHVTERTVDTHIKRIRKKLGTKNEVIETVYGLGYRLGPCEPASA